MNANKYFVRDSGERRGDAAIVKCAKPKEKDGAREEGARENDEQRRRWEEEEGRSEKQN